MALSHPQARKLPAMAKFAMHMQVFLLRRNLLGTLGEEIMVITTTGRVSGKLFSTPIGFLRDSDSVVAVTNGRGGGSNWYRNLLVNPEAVLEIQGQKYRANANPVTDMQERRRLFELYKHERSSNFHIYFGTRLTATSAKLEQAMQARLFMRFQLKPFNKPN